MLYKSGEISNFFADALTKFIPFLYFKSLRLIFRTKHILKSPLSKTKKALEKSKALCGSRGSRTPDPLLVRQML